MLELRPYQQNAIAAVSDEFERGHNHTLVVLPTGTGKTIVFAKIVELNIKGGKRALILAHRGELLEQASQKLKLACGLDTALEKAESSSLWAKELVTVGSVQTLCQERRLTRFPKDYFDLIVVDEAHHCMSESYQRILGYFNTAKVLGVTATPDRADQKNLGQFFDSKAYEYTLNQAVREGYLCPVKAQMIPLALNISGVSISNGDYAVGEIGNALEPYLEQIATEMQNYCKGRKTVVFLPLVKTSQKFCDLLKEHGFSAAEVNCESKDRSEVLKDFENGKYEVLCNSMLLTEGWDCPSVDCIIVLRPTKIRSLYQQMVGRGMRLSPNKTELLLLDFLWMTERHDLCRPSALISKDSKIAERIDKKVQENENGIDLIAAEDEAEGDAVREREEALARELAMMKQRKRKLVDPIQYALSIAAEDLANYTPTFAWEMSPPSDKQLDYLESHGIFPESVTNCGMASLLIEKLRSRSFEGLATPKQIRCLERFGFYHVGTWTFEQATKMIDRIAANHWRLPYGFDAANYVPKGA